MENSNFIISFIIGVVLFSSYTDLAYAQYTGNSSYTLEDALEERKKRLQQFDHESYFGYLECDITNIFSLQSLEGCQYQFAVGGGYFWLVLLVFGFLAIGVFFGKSKFKRKDKQE